MVAYSGYHLKEGFPVLNQLASFFAVFEGITI